MKKQSPKVLAIVLAYKDKPLCTVKSLLVQEQTEIDIIVASRFKEACINNPVQRVKCVVVEPDEKMTIGERVAYTLNVILEFFFNKKKYNYLLKSDDDVIFPSNFILTNTQGDPAIVGTEYALLLKAEIVDYILGRKWPILSADSATVISCIESATECELAWKYRVPPIPLHKESVPKLKKALLRSIYIGRDLMTVGVPLWYILLRMVVNINTNIRRRVYVSFGNISFNIISEIAKLLSMLLFIGYKSKEHSKRLNIKCSSKTVYKYYTYKTKMKITKLLGN